MRHLKQTVVFLEVTKILLCAAQASHQLVPPEVHEDLQIHSVGQCMWT